MCRSTTLCISSPLMLGYSSRLAGTDSSTGFVTGLTANVGSKAWSKSQRLSGDLAFCQDASFVHLLISIPSAPTVTATDNVCT